MNRRTFLMAAAATPAAFAQKFTPDWGSLKTHAIPAWYQDAKLGIFIHWGLYSVPAWAPPSGELGKVDRAKWFYQNPYAEWYLNSIRLKESATWKHHVETYGADFDYYQFGQKFEQQNRAWKADAWASLFQQVGARYVVLTTKHHDGYTLWPSKVPNPKRPQGGINSPRDLVGPLTSAVRGAGMKMGLYYSGGLDWTFESRPIAQMGDLRATIPQSEEYARYADAHWRELMRLYQPSILWNDIGYPKLGKAEALFADYYNTVPDGLVNNRFSAEFADITTPEYAKYDKITEKKWESCRGLGFSFGYNQVEGPEHVLAADKLIELLVDIVSKNGNLLLNIGPKPDGSISDIQTDRLKALGAWLGVNGEAIFGTRPWQTPAAKSTAGADVRYTQKGGALYATVLGNTGATVTIPGLRAAQGMQASVLGSKGRATWKQEAAGLTLQLAGSQPTAHACAWKLTPAPAVG
jgi:alpha-L-fucosidase